MNFQDQIQTQPNSSSAEDTSELHPTSHTSTKFSPSMPASAPNSQVEGSVIPSIESPTRNLFSSPGVATPRTPTFSDTYDSITDGFKRVNLSTPGSPSQIYQFGKHTGSAGFTFRNVYNTTPEPSTHLGQPFQEMYMKAPKLGSGNTTFLANLGTTQSSDSVLHTSMNLDPAHGIKLRASSAPPQPSLSAPVSKPEKYRVNDESPPEEPYFNPEFQRALKNGKDVAQQLEGILQTCQYAQDQDSHVFSMIKTSKELKQFDASSLCTIGIVGDSGTGKSSLINSLLNERDLAETAGLGAACTKVVIEYRLRQPWHVAKYTIEIDRMTNTEIEEQLYELLWSYRCFHASEMSDRAETPDEQRLEKRAELAWDTLKAAFGSKEQLTKNYLRDDSNGAIKRIQQQFAEWTNELQWPQSCDEHRWEGAAETVSECKQKIHQFTVGNLWPFIKVVRVFLSAQVLKSGCVLADLPGFHDSNNARVKAAEDYMYDCEEIFVVADIKRVATNRNVEMLLKESLRGSLKNRRPSQGISLVCTMAENLNRDEIKQKFFADNKNPDTERITLLERAVEEAEINNQRADEFEDELTYLFMTARNEYIKTLVQSNYAELFSGRPPSVFCVSNNMYNQSLRRVKIHKFLIKGSGIPTLRSHCHRIPARAQFRDAHHFLTIRLKDLVQTIQLWLAGGSREALPNDTTVRKLLETLQNDLQKTASESISNAEANQNFSAEEVFFQPMTENVGQWTYDALEVARTWNKINTIRVRMICQGSGSWTHAKNPTVTVNFNLDIIESMVYDMRPWWNVYSQKLATTLTDLQTTILGLLEGLNSQVKDFHGAPLFAENLKTKIASIKSKFARKRREALDELAKIKRDATTTQESSYILMEMRPTYYDCCEIQGEQITKQRLNRIQEAIGTVDDPILFWNIQHRLETALSELTANIINTLDPEIKRILEEIGVGIEMLRGTEAQTLAKNGDFLERLRAVLGTVLKEVEGIERTAERVNREVEEKDCA